MVSQVPAPLAWPTKADFPMDAVRQLRATMEYTAQFIQPAMNLFAEVEVELRLAPASEQRRGSIERTAATEAQKRLTKKPSIDLLAP